MLKNKKIKIIIPILAVVALAIIGGGYYYFSSRDDSSEPDDTISQTTSTAPTAQSDFSEGDDREAGNTLAENEGSGIIEDTGGQTVTGASTANPISSASGEIVLYSPGKNALVQSGQLIAGTSKLSTVSFRIIDDISGMIATGNLKVVNGRFSGKMDLATNAKEGRLDIYGTRSDGTEFSNIEVPIRFR